MTNTVLPTVVLVHGAFADASGFGGVIRELNSAGIATLAPAVPLRSLHTDAQTVRAFVDAIDGPVVLVGHSYGGAVITSASTGLANVSGLVYLAGYGLNDGESVNSVQQNFPEPELATTVRPTPYAAVGAPSGPDLLIDQARFRETFCQDLPVDIAEVMAVTQRPVAAAALSEGCGQAGWKEKPRWYLISGSDRTIHPDCQRFMADRMVAHTEVIDASHVAFISRPVAVAAFIKQALS